MGWRKQTKCEVCGDPATCGYGRGDGSQYHNYCKVHSYRMLWSFDKLPPQPGSNIDLRDWFAGLAMQALLAQRQMNFIDLKSGIANAYSVADEMMTERAKSEGPE